MCDMDNTNWDEERYIEYLEDVEIARCAITDALLFPSERIFCDLYSIPSHNHQAYYAVIYNANGKYEMTYARTEIYTRHFYEPIKMYPFSDAKAAEKHAASDGRIIIGKKSMNADLMRVLDDIFISVPEGLHLGRHLISIDGVFQAMRLFEKNNVTKEIIYRDAKEIPLSPEKTYLIDIMNDLYLTIENIIIGY